MRNNIDLRKEFDEFMDDYGFYILLHRTGRKIRCRCWSEKYQEPNSKCQICGGTGWVSRIERHKVRKQSAVQIVSRPNMTEQTKLGKIWTEAQEFKMRHDAHPKPGDYIYEVGWKGNKPTHLIQAFKINDINSLRGDNGRIDFWDVAAKAEQLDRDFKNILVRSIGSIKNYEIMK